MMLSPEHELFTKVARLLREAFPGIEVVAHEVRTFAKFPFVYFAETSNITRRGRFDYTHREDYVNLTYTIEIYSDKREGYGRRECEEIAAVIDDFMMPVGFTRTMNQPVANFNSTVSRRRMKYQCTFAADGSVYRQTGR